jgi:hypothetical protein
MNDKLVKAFNMILSFRAGVPVGMTKNTAEKIDK